MISTQTALPAVRVAEMTSLECVQRDWRNPSDILGVSSTHCPVHFNCCESPVTLWGLCAARVAMGATCLRSVGLCFSGSRHGGSAGSPPQLSVVTFWYWVQKLRSLKHTAGVTHSPDGCPKRRQEWGMTEAEEPGTRV